MSLDVLLPEVGELLYGLSGTGTLSQPDGTWALVDAERATVWTEIAGRTGPGWSGTLGS